MGTRLLQRVSKLVLVANQKGGCGKTTLADQAAALMSLADYNVAIIDADSGNRGASRRMGNANVIGLGWDVTPDEWQSTASEALAQCTAAVIDLGANFFVAAPKAAPTIRGMIDRVKADNGVFMPMVVASPNAPGTDQLVDSMAQLFGWSPHFVVCENNVDGSGNFLKSCAATDNNTVRNGFIQPGIMAARLETKQPLEQVLQDPQEGYALAMAWLARHLLDFGRQAPLACLELSPALTRLEELAKAAPSAPFYQVNTLAQAHDRALAVNAELQNQWLSLRTAALTSAQHPAHQFFTLNRSFWQSLR